MSKFNILLYRVKKNGLINKLRSKLMHSEFSENIKRILESYGFNCKKEEVDQLAGDSFSYQLLNDFSKNKEVQLSQPVLEALLDASKGNRTEITKPVSLEPSQVFCSMDNAKQNNNGQTLG